MENKNNAPSNVDKLHFLDYWRIIRIRKTIILAVFLLVVLTTAVISLFLPKSYSSTVRIRVQKDVPDIAPLTGVQEPLAYDPYFLQTEFEVIQSTPVLYKVISDLGLREKWAKRYHYDQPLTKQEAYQFLKKNLDVHQFRNTSIIEIKAYDEDAQEAADIANDVAKVYKDERLSQQSDLSTLGITALKKRLVTQNDIVSNLQVRVDSLMQKYHISDAVAEGSGYSSTPEPEAVRRIDADRIEAQNDYIQYKTLLDELTNKSPADLQKAVSVAYPDTQLPDLLTKQDSVQQQLAGAEPDLGPDNPTIIRLKSMESQIRQQITNRVDAIMQGLKAKVGALQAKVLDLSNAVFEAKEAGAKAVEQYRTYFLAKRALENQLKIRDAIMLREMQQEVDSSLPKTAIVEMVQPAEKSQRPVRPNLTLNIVLGVIVGLGLGVGLAFFIEYLDTSVKTIDDVERTLQAAVLGVIPQNVASIFHEGPESPHAEAYRVLRTNVMFSRKDNALRTLAVVSGGAGEGKSTTICNLATVFAQNGDRVLLVDSDLRRPSLHKILNLSNSLGLTNYLLRQKTLDEVIQTTSLPTLNFLPSGKLPSSSLGVLNSPQMVEFIKAVKDRYDFVFFDSPPIMGVSDASILASEVDLCLLVVQYRKYPQAMTIRAKQMVEKVGGSLIGVVLNNINISQDSYYYYYSGYYYDYYSKHDDSQKEGPEKEKSKKKAKDKGGSDAGVSTGKDQKEIELKKY